jgi:nitrite reductase (NADH) small subunit
MIASSTSMSWHRVCAIEEIPRLGARVVRARGCAAVAVFRTRDDHVFALEDKCPHRGGPLSQGIVHGNHVTCPLHDWQVELATGQALAPDEGCTASYPVRVEDGVVLVDLGEDLKQKAAAE